YMFLKLKNKPKTVLSTLLISAVVFGFLGSSLMKTVYVDEIKSIFSEFENVPKREGTGAARIFLWKMGIKMFSKSPIIGIGPENFGVYLPDYAEKHRDERVGRVYYGRILHNGYLEILVGTGIIGFSAYLLLLVASFQMNRRTRNILRSLLAKSDFAEGDFPSLLKDVNRYYYLTLAIEASQLAFMVNVGFYGIVYYKKFFWFILIISASLYSLVAHRNNSIPSSSNNSAQSRPSITC
ncbi:MAG: O-antigen ligase family protein, partial [Candidatus Hodarchaeota archaeon]